MTWSVYTADCLEFMRSLPDASVDLTVTSPPYDGIRDYGNNWSIDLPELGQSLYRLTLDGGIACVVIQDGTEDGAKTGTTARMTCAWMDAGWRLWETLIWSRPGTPGAWWNKRFRVDHEYIVVFLKGERPRAFDKEPLKVPATYAGQMPWGRMTTRTTDGRLVENQRKPNAETKCRGSVWQIAKSSYERDALKNEHPATFPQAIPEDLIRCFSVPDDTVFDPFSGSGSTGVAAIELGRDFIGTEIYEPYADIARRRCREAEEKVALLAGGVK